MPALYDQFILFGDSITQDSFSQERGFGFAAALQHAYIRKLDIVNRGFSGYNTRQALKVLSSVIPTPDQARIRFLSIFLGANDACSPWSEQHVPLEEYRRNLENIIKHPAVVAHRPRIILVAPAPIDERLQEAADLGKGKQQLARLAPSIKAYADAAVDVGNRLGVPVLNLWRLFMVRAGFNVDAWKSDQSLPGSREIQQNAILAKLMFDGLHFSPSSYEIWFHALITLINERWPDQTPEQLVAVLPLWNDPSSWETFESAAQDGTTLGA